MDRNNNALRKLLKRTENSCHSLQAPICRLRTVQRRQTVLLRRKAKLIVNFHLFRIRSGNRQEMQDRIQHNVSRHGYPAHNPLFAEVFHRCLRWAE